jgi:Flp pilus assembly protein TadG
MTTEISRMSPHPRRVASSRRQRGVALPLVVIGLVAMLALVGLALDTSHALTNKTRLQNTVDAAALAAAKAYDQSSDVLDGNAAALSLFGINAKVLFPVQNSSCQFSPSLCIPCKL